MDSLRFCAPVSGAASSEKPVRWLSSNSRSHRISPFSLGGSHPQEYALRAIELGLPAFAIADRNSVAGLVRAHQELKEAARGGAIVPRLLPAARLCLAEGPELTALPRNRAGWARLCRLLTDGARRAAKGTCLLHPDDLTDLGDLHLLLHPPSGRGIKPWLPQARALVRRHPHAHLVAAPRYDGQDVSHLARFRRLADDLRLPLVASAEPVMHHGSRRRLVDVLTCIREGIRIDAIGRAALANAERRLRSEAEMLRLFAGHEAAVHRSGEIAADCRFRLDELRYEYPREIWEGEDPQARLERLTAQGAEVALSRSACRTRSPAQAAHELALIGRLGYAPYFLTVSDIVDFAREPGHPLPGPRLGGELGRSASPRHHRGRSPRSATMVFERFVSDGAQRAARHRRRLRARAARGGDPVHLREATAASAPGSARR